MTFISRELSEVGALKNKFNSEAKLNEIDNCDGK